MALGLLATLALAGCGSTGDGGPSMGQTLTNLVFLNEANPPPAPPPTEARKDLYCPPVSVLPGTAAMSSYAGAEGDPMALRYQVSVGETARECVDLGAEVSIRVGVQGRVIAGPKGGGGASVDVPIRVVLVDRKDNPVYSNLTRVRATLPSGQTHQTFSHVEEGLTLPVPEGGLRGYRILVGFDSQGAQRRNMGRGS
ncbi:hypothetical protein GCM10007276_10240 [Agaricicola taiwanensis]|uniref:Lipoprotein n=2 Tax=Agaricicola taiwanensis TaxID=591372 RepID=A0A8J2VNH8_9RHOB|nr:hypothetical protein GCM10007276_10240 [Agaricicola taiwanensis]